MELIIILIFILLNGVFSMSEIAVISSRKSKLDSKLKEGNTAAGDIIKVKESPDKFLSTIQIAITTIGLIIGLYTGEQYVDKFSKVFVGFGLNESLSVVISRIIIVLAETFVMLVLGELVPKRIGMTNPERIAVLMVKPLKVISKIVYPFVWLLSKTTNSIFSLLGYKQAESSNATEDEIKSIIEESADAGEINKREQNIVNRVFDLDDRGIVSLMTPRPDLEWVEKDLSLSEIMEGLSERVHYIYPVVEKNLDNIVGVIYIKDILRTSDKDNTKAADIMREPNFIHESVGVYDVLEIFKKTKVHYAFIIDEFGLVQGMITMNDILEALVDNSSDLQSADDEPEFVKQTDGSYIVDGQYPFYDFLSHLNMKDKYTLYNYNTVSGLVLAQTGRLPEKGGEIEWESFKIKILDIKGVRIDKILVTENKTVK
ncbi:MAG: HlyC/CorC family transporter [Bacteroidales bacterium]|nr:HlyC/CorC family transporter [Bacteroidales bacterium]